MRVIRVSAQYCSRVWSKLLTPVNEAELPGGAYRGGRDGPVIERQARRVPGPVDQNEGEHDSADEAEEAETVTFHGAPVNSPCISPTTEIGCRAASVLQLQLAVVVVVVSIAVTAAALTRSFEFVTALLRLPAVLAVAINLAS